MQLSSAFAALAGLSLLVWMYMLTGRSGFWRAQPRIEKERPSAPPTWPQLVAIMPARDEADHVAAALRSLLDQDFPGNVRIVLVDDHSEDATPAIAEKLKSETSAARSLEVIAARPLPPGWTGKLWAMAEGVRHLRSTGPEPRYVLFTDADVVHAPDALGKLLAKAEADRLDAASLMVRLSCASFWERLLIPPFIFFFQMLYPFATVNDPRRRIAAAAGGCMLVRRNALEQAGGLEAIRGALIDDVALARAIKRRPGGGRIWLGLSSETQSLRRYATLESIWAMVARTADTQLRHSLLRLAATVAGMALVFLFPPLATLGVALHGDVVAAVLGLLAWIAMCVAYRPMVRFYRLPALWAATLPAAAALYVAMTVDSALRHRRGAGGTWKGREYRLQR